MTTALHARACAALTAVALAALAQPALAADDQPYTVVASGLNSPRHLSFARNGDLYIAESGAPSADAGACADHPEFGEVCLAHTSSITLLDRTGRQSRPVTGLPAIVNADGEATGASDVVALGTTLTVAMGLGGTPELRSLLGSDADLLGTVVEVKTRGGRQRTSVLADLARYEADRDPDAAGADSNPVDVVRDGSHILTVDAGGNSVLRLTGPRRGVREFAVFDQPVLMDPPPIPGPPPGWPTPFPAQSVPTAVAQGPDGAWYVSELTGFPFQPGKATIWRIARDGSRTAYATGLTTVTDLAWDRGTLYAVQISDAGLLSGVQGSLVRVDRSGAHQTVVGDLFAPYGVAIRRGQAYVTTGSVAPGAGQVIQVALR
ncbi:ScyD/ScyE family protein [Propioniciclava soli]|uniref:ScyD/ScyE family protein n=1 Tax=Propioniciclava soli TaxID=2775081 RepID=A0ABZ3C6D7_9ACTN